VLAALIATAIDADLNSLSVVVVEDYYRRFRPDSTDRERLFVGKVAVGITGVVTIGVAAVLAHSEGTALKTAFQIASVVSGGVTGLFALAFLSGRATAGGAYVGIASSVLFTAWATITSKAQWSPAIIYSLDPLLIGVFATLLLFGVGYVASPLFGRPTSSAALTLPGWLRVRNAHRADNALQTPPEFQMAEASMVPQPGE
jgi:solute:Na+ symporter, SSS family